MPSLNPDTALAELRSATRAEHDRIEQVLRLTEPMALARYAVVMGGFDAFLGAWEPRVHTALPPRLRAWFEGRRRGAFAARDVAWLRDVAGVAPAPVDASAALALPLAGLPEVLGSLYVIEGSALGGRVIAPRLQETLGLGPNSGARYFQGFGDGTGAMWREFREVAAREIGESPQDVADACAGARRTFAALIALFAPALEAGSRP